MFGAIWRFRHFILASIRGEIKTRFARSYLGAGWYILQPLVQTAIFAIVLTEVLRARFPNVDSPVAYPVYLVAGMTAWGLFSELVNRCTNIFMEFGPVIKKISFPRLCLPIIVLGSALINHGMLLIAAAIVCTFLGHPPNLAWVSILVGIASIAMFAFGLGIFLGILNVFTRDVAQFVGIALQLWFWLTPIVYPSTAIPESVAGILAYNPMVPMVAVYQDALLYGKMPDIAALLTPLLVSFGLLALSLALFRRASHELVDAL